MPGPRGSRRADRGARASAVGDRADLALKGVWGTDGAGEAELLRVAHADPRARLSRSPRRRARRRRRSTRRRRRPRRLRRPGRPAASPARVAVDARSSRAIRRARRGRPRRERASGLAPRRSRPPTALLGGALALKGRRRAPRATASRFADLRARGARLALRLDGSATGGAADLAPRSPSTDLARVDERLAGRADAVARLTGSLARPTSPRRSRPGTVRARSAGRCATCAPRSTRATSPAPLDARLSSRARSATSACADGARLRRAGTDWSPRPSRPRGRLRRRSRGRAALDAAGPREGTLTIAAPDLDDLSPLVLTPLGGSLDADLILAAARTAARTPASSPRGRSLRAGAVALARPRRGPRRHGPLRPPSLIDGRLARRAPARRRRDASTASGSTATRPRAGERPHRSRRGRAASHSTGAAACCPATGTRLDLASLRAQRGGAPDRPRAAGLASPCDDGSRDRSGPRRRGRGGRIDLRDRSGQTLDLDLGVAGAAARGRRDRARPASGLPAPSTATPTLRAAPPRRAAAIASAIARVADAADPRRRPAPDRRDCQRHAARPRRDARGATCWPARGAACRRPGACPSRRTERSR